MRKYTKFLAGTLAGVLLAAGLAVLAQTANLTQYIGYNPITNVLGQQGLALSVGALPTLGASTACGTTATVSASMVGGTSVFQATANNATTCTLQIVYPAAAAAPNGVFCVAFDETTRAATFQQTAHTTTSSTVSATAAVVSGDKILIECNAF